MSLSWNIFPHDLHLSSPLRTLRGSISQRRVWLVQVADNDVVGWGEASPLPGFGGEQPEDCLQALASIPDQARAALGYAQSLGDRAPCAAAAIRGALADRSARQRGLPLARQLAAATGSRPRSRLRCNALLVDPRTASFSPPTHGCYKWKSSGNIDADIATAHQLSEQWGTEVKQRIDANGGWSIDDCRRFAKECQGLAIDYVEQPLPVGQEEALAALTEVQLRVGLDESLSSLATIGRVLSECWAEVLVIKMQWLGGFPALRQIVHLAQARHPRRVVVSSTLDSCIGRAHALHACAALGLDHEFHGLDTGALLANDPSDGEGATITGGDWRLPETSGLGVEWPIS